MAERLDLQGLLNGSRRENQFAGLLDDALAPGSVFGGFLGEQRTPQKVDALQTVRGGSERLGIDPWASLFDADTGQVTDVQGLLRSLNLGETLSQRPMSQWGFQQKYGLDAGRVYQDRYGLNPNGISPYGDEYATPNNPAKDPFGLGAWVHGLGANDPYSQESIAYAPEFRFSDTNLEGLDLNNATLDDLNAWAQQNYGVDALTLAASSDQLLDTRQQWTQDPSIWFDPNDPSAIQATMIPGLSAEDSALRLASYSDAYQRQQEASRLESDLAFQRMLDSASMSDPELGRSAFGQYLTQVLGPSRGYEGQLAQPVDTSFLYQQGIFPEQLQQALAQAGMQF